MSGLLILIFISMGEGQKANSGITRDVLHTFTSLTSKVNWIFNFEFYVLLSLSSPCTFLLLRLIILRTPGKI